MQVPRSRHLWFRSSMSRTRSGLRCPVTVCACFWLTGVAKSFEYSKRIPARLAPSYVAGGAPFPDSRLDQFVSARWAYPEGAAVFLPRHKGRWKSILRPGRTVTHAADQAPSYLSLTLVLAFPAFSQLFLRVDQGGQSSVVANGGVVALKSPAIGQAVFRDGHCELSRCFECGIQSIRADFRPRRYYGVRRERRHPESG